jgi:hypothetical protein
VKKASTMRLALWVSKGTSAIWLTGTSDLGKSLNCLL